MPPKRPSEQGSSAMHARKIRVVGASPKRGTGSTAPIASLIADFRETLGEVPHLNSMLIVIGDTPEAATDKLKQILDHQGEAELREWNQAHYVCREVATKIFRIMGVHMALLYEREQHADARRSLLQFLELHQVDLGNIFHLVTGPSLYRAVTNLSELNNLNEANTAIHSVTVSQTLYAISLFTGNRYHAQPNVGPLPSPLRLPSRECLDVLTTILKCILGVSVEVDLLQLYKDESRSLGDILDSYSAQTNFDELEPMQSIKIDWIPTGDEKHWGKVVVVGLAVPQQEHQEELKEPESEVQHAKEAAKASAKETLPNKGKNRTLQSEVKALKKRVKRLERENEKRKAEHLAIKAEHEAIKGEHVAIKAEHEAIKEEHVALKAEHANLKGKIVRLHKRVEDMEKSWKETVTLFIAQFALLQAQIDQLEEKRAQKHWCL